MVGRHSEGFQETLTIHTHNTVGVNLDLWHPAPPGTAATGSSMSPGRDTHPSKGTHKPFLGGGPHNLPAPHHAKDICPTSPLKPPLCGWGAGGHHIQTLLLQTSSTIWREGTPHPYPEGYALMTLTSSRGRSWELVSTMARRPSTPMPWHTLPKMLCFPSSHCAGPSVRKNWLPLVSGPALAIARIPAPVRHAEMSPHRWGYRGHATPQPRFQHDEGHVIPQGMLSHGPDLGIMENMSPQDWDPAGHHPMAVILGTCHSMVRFLGNLSPDRGVLVDISNNLFPLMSSPIMATSRIPVPAGHRPSVLAP